MSKFPLTPYNDPTPKSNWGTFYYFKNIFNDQMISELEVMVNNNYTFSKGKTGVVELDTITDSYKTNNKFT